MKWIANFKLVATDVLPPGNLAEKFSSFLIISLYIILVLKGELFGFNTSIIILAVFSIILFLLLSLSGKIHAPKLILLPLIAFSVILFASAISSQVPEESLSKILLYLSSFVVFISSFSLAFKKDKYLIWFVNMVLILGLYIILKFFINFVLADSMQAGIQFVGPFFWHNQMAGFLLFLIPIPLVTIFFKRKINVVIWLIPLAVILTALIFTYSRAAWVSAVLSLIPLGYFLKSRIRIGGKSILLIATGLLISFFFLANNISILNRIKSISSELLPSTRTTSGNLRASVYASSFKVIKDHPILGVGPGVFGQAFHKYQSKPWLYAANAHNHFLQIAVETGFLGFIFFSLIFILIGVSIFKYRKVFMNKDDEKSIYLMALVISLTAAFIHNLFDVDWNLPSLSFIFWSFTGTLMGSLSWKKKELIVPNKKALLLSLILFSVLISAQFYSNKFIQKGKNFYFQRNYDESLVNLSKADMLFPYLYTSHFYRARIFHDNKDFINALDEYNKSIGLNPFLAESEYSKGTIYLELGDIERAKMHINEAINKNPHSSPHYYKTLADIYFIEGDTKKASDVLEKAVNEVFPINEAFNNFSYLYRFTGFDKSLANIYLAYAQLLARQGNPAEAKNVVEQAILYLDPVNVRLQKLDSNLKNALP